MLRRLLMISAAALALAGVAAGCGDEDSGASGGDGDGGTITTSSLSKEQFVEQANDLCKRSQKRLTGEINAYTTKSQKENPNASPTEAFAGAGAVALRNFEGMIDDLRGLGAPEGDEEELKALLTEMQSGVDTLQRQLSSEPARVEQGDNFFRVLDSSAAMARDYGIGACALS